MSINWDDGVPGGEWSAKTLSDGFGNIWRLCTHPECDLCVVRPGKVQCSGFCEGFSNDAAEKP